MRKKHRELSLQLLRVMRKVDLLEGRFASAMGYWSSQQKGAAADLARQLSQLEAQVAPGASGELPSFCVLAQLEERMVSCACSKPGLLRMQLS